MTAWITIVNGIIIAIAVQVQTVDGFGVQVCGIVGRDEPSPLGGVIPGITAIQAGVGIVVIATVTNGVGIGDNGIGSLAGNCAITPGIIQIFPLYA